MKIVITALALLFIGFGLYNKSRKDTHLTLEQRTYSYVNESLGYSDISQLYVADSNTSSNRPSFFNSKSLQKATAAIRCKITETLIRYNDSSVSAIFQMYDPQIDIRGIGGLTNMNGLEEDIKHPVLVEFFSNGKINNLKMDTSISFFAASIVKQIISFFQFTKPEIKSDTWIASETDNAGAYTVSYQLAQETNLGNRYRKTNMQYLPDTSLIRFTKNIPHGLTTIDTDTSGGIIKENFSGEMVSVFGIDTIAMSKSNVSLSLENTQKVPGTDVSEMTAPFTKGNFRSFSSLADDLSEGDISRMVYQHTLGNDDLQTLLDTLNVMANAPDSSKEILTMKFRALASLSPEACRSLGTLLETEPYGTTRFEIIGNALLRTESATATNVISKLIWLRKDDENLALNFLTGLATTSVPTDSAVYVTKQLGFELPATPATTSTAQLALGGIAHSYKLIDPSAFSAITDYLLAHTQNFTDTLQRILILGNTGSDKIVPLIHFYLNHPDVSVTIKAYSISALRFVDTDKFNDIIKTVLTKRDSTIDKAVAETIEFRKSFFQKKRN